LSWHAQIISLMPDFFPGPLAQGLAGRALKDGLWSVACTPMRDFGEGRHKNVDDTPAGGGVGMIIRADIAAAAIDAARHEHPDLPLVYLTPRGRPLTQNLVRDLAAGPGAMLFCSRFEGVDERVLEARPGLEISLGDYILSGGEIAGLCLLDAIIRLLPGVMGKAASADSESFEDDLLEYPHYTRPQIWEERSIPEILLSGDHQRVAKWRLEAAEALTKSRRPDLWARYVKKYGKNAD
jgi:tRNA (guanine37-N1)-methyltransferase